MTTLSYLVEAGRGNVGLPEDAGFRLEPLSLQMTRLLDVIAHEMPGREDAAGAGEVSLRPLAGQVTQLARVAHESFGGSLEAGAPAGGGALVRIVLPVEPVPSGAGHARDVPPASPATDPGRPPASQVST